jgi:hypothetical protein
MTALRTLIADALAKLAGWIRPARGGGQGEE